MVGKKTSDNYLSGSGLAVFDPDYPYGLTPIELLDRCIRARKGENVRDDNQKSFMRIGDVLENPLLDEACLRLGLTNVRLNIEAPLHHSTLPISGSVDGIATAGVIEALVVGPDSEKGIYTPDNKYLQLKGDGILECKVTRDFGEEELPNWRGKWQAMAYMEMAQLTWCAVCVLYNSTDFKIFVFERDPEFSKWFEETVTDFERRVKEEDYYEPKNSLDVNIVYPTSYDEMVELPYELVENLDEICHANNIIKNLKKDIDDHEKVIKAYMADKKHAVVGNYRVTWGSRTYKERPERVVAKKESYTIRSKTIQIKEAKNELN